jgi:hypothetical protein
MNLKHIAAYLVVCSLVVALQPIPGLAQQNSGASTTSAKETPAERDGQHDFDFEIGTWKTHLRRLVHPLTGSTTCVTVTLVDGLVLSRSAFDHSMNYRCVVAFGTARKVADPEQKIKSLRVISEHLIADRWEDVREPSEKELKATTVLEFSIEEASSKVRGGPPLDDESDYGLRVWAGVLPLEMRSLPPIPDDKLIKGVTLPDYVRRFDARLNGRKDG